MTRGQLAALFLIGGVAALAYLQSYEVAQYFKRKGVDLSKQKEAAI